MAATSYAAEQEGEVSLFQFQSPDMDMEPPHFVSGIHSATRGKRSRRSRHSLSLIPRSEIAAQQQDQEDQEQDQEDQEVQEEGGEAEEEMAARCLMMLLSDGSDRQSNSPTTTSSSESLAPSTLQPAIRRRIKKPKRFDVEDADSPYNSLEWDADLKQGMMVRLYACKSCNKKFSSFQALGGHRASCHYKSISVLPRLDTDEGLKENCSFYGPSVENNNKQNLCTETKKVRVHECPVCHRNFSSGQALGGHKRTHSTPVATNIHTSTSLSTTEQQQLLPPRGAETLDLNMPAEDVNDRTQMQHSSPVSVNLEGDLLDSTSWTHSDYKPISYNSSRPWWMESHQPGVIREDEADSQLGSNSGFVRGRDLGCKRAGLPLITTVN